MTDAHKEALAKGRAEGGAVRDYLEVLKAHKPRRGRRGTPESIRNRLSAIDTDLFAADPLTELKLLQERRDLEKELASSNDSGVDMAELEKAFVKIATRYSERQGIAYSTWREIGIDAAVLKKAGLTRSG